METVFLQQQCFLAAKQITKGPRQLWLEEMGDLIKQKIGKGHQIILTDDVNESVKEPLIQSWANSIGIFDADSQTTSTEIPTHQRGRKAIDGIFLKVTHYS